MEKHRHLILYIQRTLLNGFVPLWGSHLTPTYAASVPNIRLWINKLFCTEKTQTPTNKNLPQTKTTKRLQSLRVKVSVTLQGKKQTNK